MRPRSSPRRTKLVRQAKLRAGRELTSLPFVHGLSRAYRVDSGGQVPLVFNPFVFNQASAASATSFQPLSMSVTGHGLRTA